MSAHSMAAANEYRRVMGEDAVISSGILGGALGDGDVQGHAGAGSIEQHGVQDLSPVTLAGGEIDDFQDCDDKQQLWIAPATAEEEPELPPEEREPTDGMLFVQVVELDLPDAPEHMPIQIELRLQGVTWTSSAVQKRFASSSGESDSSLLPGASACIRESDACPRACMG